MRVLFIYPNVGCQIGFNYGLAHISAVLKAAGHEVSLINVCEKLDPHVSPEEVAAQARAFRPQVIGLSVVTNQFAYACELAERLRDATSAPLVCGGPHATMTPEETLATGVFDFVCVGEGEFAMLDLVRALESRGDTTCIRNIWTRDGGEVYRNPVRPFCDLAALPREDYALFDFQKLIDAKQGWVGLMATRGCPFQCAYCFNHAMLRLYRREAGSRTPDYVRRQPIENLLSEIGFLLDTYAHITTFIFDDDIFTLDKGWLREFSEEYGRRYHVPFVCNSHVKFFDDARAVVLKEAGCWMVKFGLESGSERVRKAVLRRPMSNREIAEAFAAAHRHGLQTSAFVMIGLPDETAEDLQETIDLLAHIRPSRFRWSVFFPMPGTHLHDVCVERNLIDSDKMAQLTNFMDDTCLKLDDAPLALVRRLRRSLPWFVNAQLPGPEGQRFAELAQRILEAPEEQFEELHAAGERLCQALAGQAQPYYEIKYNRFMAVRTDAPGM